MSLNIIRTLTYKDIVDLLFQSRYQVVWASANIYIEVAEILKERRRKGIDVSVIIDSTEEVYRNGLGEVKAISILQEAGCKVYEVENNRVSFFICDNEGYFLFNQSRTLEEEGLGTNAVSIDAVTCQQLLLHYFPPKDIFESTQRIQKMEEAIRRNQFVASESKKLIDEVVGKKQVKSLDDRKFEQVSQSLKENPPLSPDLKRQITIYTSKFQFVEFEFIGAQLSGKKISLSSNILPIKDAKLKKDIETKLRILDDSDKIPQKWLDLKQKVDEIRKEYLVKITFANKNILPKASKPDFLSKVAEIENELVEAKAEFIDFFDEQIYLAKDRLIKELKAFFTENPPIELKYSVNKSHYDDVLNNYIISLVSNIKFPNLTNELEKIEFKKHYFDLTWEDLNNEKFLNEMKTKGLITDADFSELRELDKAFKLKQ